jgi:2-C-methyl-D-erythritol 4-phosphate cytidylyltransferase
MIAVNYVAPVQIARLGVNYLKETKGQLLLFTSSSYTRGRAGYSLYSSTKAAVVNLTQALADEWLSIGVRVNCINPERTATPMRARAFGEERPQDLLDAVDVAQTSVDALVADVTGQVIDVRRPTTALVAPASGAGEGVAVQAELREEEAAAEAAREHKAP